VQPALPGELAAGDVHASTIALNWMIEHHIIYTISGHDHRPARRAMI